MSETKHVVTVLPEALPRDEFRGPEFGRYSMKAPSVQRQGPKNLLRERVACTVCLRKDYPNLRRHKIHPALKVLVCSECNSFYKSGEFLKDENGIDEHCRWCADGGETLFICDICPNVFCKTCISQNCEPDTSREIFNASSFICFVCNPIPIVAKVRQCKEIFQLLIKKSKTAGKTISISDEESDEKDSSHETKAKIHSQTARFSQKHTSPTSAVSQKESPKRVPKITIHVGARKATENPLHSPDASSLRIHTQSSLENKIPKQNGRSEPTTPSGDRSVAPVYAWKSRLDRMLTTVQEFGTEMESQFSVNNNNTLWSKFAAMKTVQEMKKKSKCLVDAASQMDSFIRRLEETLCNETNRDSSTTPKDSDGLSDETVFSSPTRKKLLRKRRERELLRQSASVDDSAAGKSWKVAQKSSDDVRPHPETDKGATKMVNGAAGEESMSDIFDSKTEAAEISTTDSDLEPSEPKPNAPDSAPDVLREAIKAEDDEVAIDDSTQPAQEKERSHCLSSSSSSTPSISSASVSQESRRKSKIEEPNTTLTERKSKQQSPTKSIRETADRVAPDAVSSDTDPEVIPSSVSPAAIFSSAVIASLSKTPVKDEEPLFVPQASAKKPKKQSELQVHGTLESPGDSGTDEDAALFKPIRIRKSSKTQGSDSGSSGGETPTNKSIAKEAQKSPRSAAKKRKRISRPNPLDYSDPEVEISSESDLNDDDQRLPNEPVIGGLTASPEKPGTALNKASSRSKQLNDNDVAYDCLMKGMLQDSDSDVSDDDVNEVLQQSAAKAPTVRKKTEPTSDSSENNTTGVANSQSDCDTRKAKVVTHPLLNVPISVSDDEKGRTPTRSGTKRKTFQRGSTQKKRRKLCLDEALKTNHLSEDDFQALTTKSLGTKGLRVVLSDINNDESLKKYLSQKEQPAQVKREASNVESNVEPDTTDSESLIPPDPKKTKDADDQQEKDQQEEPGSDDSSILGSRYGEDHDEDSEDVRDSDFKLLESDSSSSPVKQDRPRRMVISDEEEEEEELPAFFDNQLWSKGKKKREPVEVKTEVSSGNEFADATPSKNKKRRRIMFSESDSDDESKLQDGKKAGRRNIRKILDDNLVSQETQDAERIESERRRRMEEDDDVEEEVVIIEDESSPVKKMVTTRLILSKDPLVEVDNLLVRVLKPHQVEGVKFIWMNVIESVARANKGKGDGCILAHCMGLGKTLQIVTFLHTVINTPHLPKIRNALVLCPLGTVSNWVREFSCWTKSHRSLRVFNLANISGYQRMIDAKRWKRLGGVLVISYGLFRTICDPKAKTRHKACFKETLMSPDVIVCDEGHIIKNAKTNLSSLVDTVNTRRRIVLTGTPLQNNLMEYHCMVSFIKKRLLGSAVEFANRFANPIRNGQHVDSTRGDVQLMKKRSHILHKLLKACVQRKDISCLREHLQPKYEYVLLVRLSPLQVRLYDTYLEKCTANKQECLFLNFNNLLSVVCHPRVLQLSKQRRDKKEYKESIRNFIDDQHEDDEEEEEDEEGEEQDEQEEKETTEETVAKMSVKELKRVVTEKGGDLRGVSEKSDLIRLATSLLKPATKDGSPPESWFESVMPTQDKLFHAIEHGSKIVLLMEILNQAAQVKDKVVLFSQSILALDLIEEVLHDVTKQREANKEPRLEGAYWRWYKNSDYFRIDGSTSATNRKRLIDTFNNKRDARGRLFLVSTKAGGIGVNLVGANRAIVFDACWNPTHDMQSIFRIYRFGQNKPCFVYRFIAQGTMEEKIYDRQVVKQSLAFRVIDEQQVERHFTAQDISELYEFKPDKLDKHSAEKLLSNRPPKDALLAKILQQPRTCEAIVSYHEHDSLLDHVVEEELSEAEQRLAWDEFDRERHLAITAHNHFFKFSHGDLRNLIALAEEELRKNTEMMDKCKDEPFHLTMLKLKACDVRMTYDDVCDAASRVQMQRCLLKQQLLATRKFIVQKLEEMNFCLSKKAPPVPISSTSYNPQGFNNLPRAYQVPPRVQMPPRPHNPYTFTVPSTTAYGASTSGPSFRPMHHGASSRPTKPPTSSTSFHGTQYARYFTAGAGPRTNHTPRAAPGVNIRFRPATVPNPAGMRGASFNAYR